MPEARRVLDDPHRSASGRGGQARVAVSLALLLGACAAPWVARPPLAFTRLAGSPGGLGDEDGPAAEARFNRPYGLALDRDGSLYVAEWGNHSIRKVWPDGLVGTLAGKPGSHGYADGPAAEARFNYPQDVEVGDDGRIYVADRGNSAVRAVSPDGAVTTLAGGPERCGAGDGPPGRAGFLTPTGIALDPAGGLLVADEWSHAIRGIAADGSVFTLAGVTGTSGFRDGVAAEALFNQPTGVAVTGSGDILVADRENHVLRRLRGGSVTTVAGEPGPHPPGVLGDGRDGDPREARFSYPQNLAVLPSGEAYLADAYDYAVRFVGASGRVSTVAGKLGEAGARDGPAAEARFGFPADVAFDPARGLFVADANTSTIRLLTPSGAVTTFAGRMLEIGDADGSAAQARFNWPAGLAVDGHGSVYVADAGNHVVRRIDRRGNVTTIAGRAGVRGTTDAVGPEARFDRPTDVAVGRRGELYVADSGNCALRRIDRHGRVTTVAGKARDCWAISQGPAPRRRFAEPTGVALDPNGDLLVADARSYTILRVTAGGEISVLAGRPFAPGHSDGPAAEARFNRAARVVVDRRGAIYVADGDSVRRIDRDGIVRTLAQPAMDVAVDRDGAVLAVACWPRSVRRIAAEGTVDLLAAPAALAGAERAQPVTPFGCPQGIAVDRRGRVYLADSASQSVWVGRRALRDLPVLDRGHGPVGEERRFDVIPRTGARWRWSVVRRPAASRAALSSPTRRRASFTPDAPGRYVFRLEARRGRRVALHDVELVAVKQGPSE